MSTITTAMIFAAGKGTRMRHLTAQCPKPLLEIAGKSILQRLIEELPGAGITDLVVNSWYHAEQVENYLGALDSSLNIKISHEEELLDTGGGAKKALPLLGDQPFWAFNGDMLWSDTGNDELLQTMSEAWDPEKMDLLLSLYPTHKVQESGLIGDYHINEQGQLKRTRGEPADYIFAGARICKPDLLEGHERDAFSFLEIFDKAQKQGRLYGVVYHGSWFHLSTPELLQQTNDIFLQKEKNNIKSLKNG